MMGKNAKVWSQFSNVKDQLNPSEKLLDEEHLLWYLWQLWSLKHFIQTLILGNSYRTKGNPKIM